MAEEPHGQDCDEDSADERIEHLLTGIELQMLLIPGTNAGDTDINSEIQSLKEEYPDDYYRNKRPIQ